MPLIIFECPGTPTLEVNTPGGKMLVDICDEHNAAVPFSCRGASCGTCRVDVLEGMELVTPPLDVELDVLDVFGDDPQKRRLACQLRVKRGEGRLHIRPADPE
jgi:2Fe-2S ferredoxin